MKFPWEVLIAIILKQEVVTIEPRVTLGGLVLKGQPFNNGRESHNYIFGHATFHTAAQFTQEYKLRDNSILVRIYHHFINP